MEIPSAVDCLFVRFDYYCHCVRFRFQLFARSLISLFIRVQTHFCVWQSVWLIRKWWYCWDNCNSFVDRLRIYLSMFISIAKKLQHNRTKMWTIFQTNQSTHADQQKLRSAIHTHIPNSHTSCMHSEWIIMKKKERSTKNDYVSFLLCVKIDKLLKIETLMEKWQQ